MLDRIGQFTQTQYTLPVMVTAKPDTSAPQGKETFLDKFQNSVKNSADMTDTIIVPRTIFKGYLGIMIGTALATLGAFIPKPKALSTALKVSGLGVSTYGTWAFVRPFIIKDAKGVEHKK